jgi:hypothetical protein
MDKLISKVKRIIAKTLPGAKMHLWRQGGTVGGVLAWTGFEGMAQIDRQVKLRSAINSSLDVEERPQVSFILTMTPGEDAAIAADERRLGISPRKRTA